MPKLLFGIKGLHASPSHKGAPCERIIEVIYWSLSTMFFLKAFAICATLMVSAEIKNKPQAKSFLSLVQHIKKKASQINKVVCSNKEILTCD